MVLMVLPAAADLERLVEFQRRGDAGCFVSSGFHEWRTISRYRSRAGLHNGYDIAMLAGSPARSAWGGEVVAVTFWWGEEYGVTVRHPDGFEVTYGHLLPALSEGDLVEPDTILGWVAIDHVDVKMRAPDGRYVDFGQEPYRLPIKTAPAVKTISPERFKKLELLKAAGLISRNEYRRRRALIESSENP